MTSSVYAEGGHVTLAAVMERFDEKGNRVTGRDPNTYTQAYHCTNGHRWSALQPASVACNLTHE